MSFIIDIQRAFSDPTITLPTDKFIQQVLTLVLKKFRNNAEVSVRIVDDNEITALNSRYRHKNYPTNVLSFPIELPTGIKLEHELLGDIVIASSVVSQEAVEQSKSFLAHFTHMLIHGTLHLLGFDHQNNNEAEIMEHHEIALMQELNFDNPFLSDHSALPSKKET